MDNEANQIAEQIAEQKVDFLRRSKEDIIAIYSLQKEFITNLCNELNGLAEKKPDYLPYEIQLLKERAVDRWASVERHIRERILELAKRAVVTPSLACSQQHAA